MATKWEDVGDFAQGENVMHISEDDVEGESGYLSGYWRHGPAKHSGYRDFYFDPVLTYGDYSRTGSVGKANVQVFLEEFGDVPGVYEVHEAYGTVSVAIDVDVDNQDILEALSSLADYPLLDEDALSEVEHEEESEAWDNWARSDFITALENEHGLEDVDEVDEDKLFELFWRASDSAGEYWEHSGEGAYINVEKVAKAVDPDKLVKLGAVYEED